MGGYTSYKNGPRRSGSLLTWLNACGCQDPHISPKRREPNVGFNQPASTPTPNAVRRYPHNTHINWPLVGWCYPTPPRSISGIRPHMSDLRSQISDLRFQILDLTSQISDRKFQTSDLTPHTTSITQPISHLIYPNSRCETR